MGLLTLCCLEKGVSLGMAVEGEDAKLFHSELLIRVINRVVEAWILQKAVINTERK